jgi:hypothetical protein
MVAFLIGLSNGIPAQRNTGRTYRASLRGYGRSRATACLPIRGEYVLFNLIVFQWRARPIRTTSSHVDQQHGQITGLASRRSAAAGNPWHVKAHPSPPIESRTRKVGIRVVAGRDLIAVKMTRFSPWVAATKIAAGG